MAQSALRRVKTKIGDPDLVRRKHLQIIRAASDLFSQKGYHQTTMREISSASGIELSYLYKYISTKNDVLYLFYEYLHQQWIESFEELSEFSEEDFVTRLRNFISSFVDVAAAMNDEILTMYTESRHLEKEWLHSVLELENSNTRLFQQFIDKGIEAGVFHVPDSFMAANIVQFLLVIRALRGWNFKQYSTERFKELTTDFVLKGLGVQERSRRGEGQR